MPFLVLLEAVKLYDVLVLTCLRGHSHIESSHSLRQNDSKSPHGKEDCLKRRDLGSFHISRGEGVGRKEEGDVFER